MEAFKAVDQKNLNKVYQGDGQSDWLNWKAGEKKSKSAAYKNSRHIPAFPKLGTRTNTDAKDDSNYQVGAHDRVLAPSEIAVKPKNLYGAKEHLKREEEKEREIRELKRKREEDEIAREKFQKLQSNSTDNNYSRVDAQHQTSTARSQHEFIPSESFKGMKEGYAFKTGSKGLGYYSEVSPSTKDENIGSGSGANTPVLVEAKKPKRKLPKRRAQDVYAASLMDVAANAISNLQAQQKQSLPNTLSPNRTRSINYPVPLRAPPPDRSSTSQVRMPRPPQTQPAESSAGKTFMPVPPPQPPPAIPSNEWKTLRDPLTRKLYYLNTRTQETTYTKPF